MKKTLVVSFYAIIIVTLSILNTENIWSQSIKNVTYNENNFYSSNYKFPEFYKGIYLTIGSGKNFEKLSALIEKSKKSKLNTFVIDVQGSKSKKCVIPKEHIDFCIKNGFHPIARIVVFPNGLKKYPVSRQKIINKLIMAESACQNGFKEIQFDYIRFNDYSVSENLSLKKRYRFIEGFLKNAKQYLKKYNVKIAADVFGRIPLNKQDAIGQRMEGLDKVVDIICPMAYPSHYTWSKNLMGDPYYTVLLTSQKAKERTKKAEIVTYIQAFRMKLKISNLSFNKYIEEQIQAVHDSGIKGFLLWNASQDYKVPFNVLEKFYTNKASKNISSDI